MTMTEQDKQGIIDGRNVFRDNIRAIMRGVGVDDWQAHDIIREITEWHDEGRPQVALMTAKERKAWLKTLKAPAPGCAIFGYVGGDCYTDRKGNNRPFVNDRKPCFNCKEV